MAKLKKINKIRKKITHGLTQGIGKTDAECLQIPTEKIKRILVIRPNHRLGNLLLITPLLQELENRFPQAKIDVFLKGGLGPVVLKEYPSIENIISLPRDHFRQLPNYISTWFELRKKKYDLVINAVPHSSSGKISTKLTKSEFKIFGDEISNYDFITENYQHIAKLPVCYLRKSMKMQPEEIQNEIPGLDLKLSPEEIESGKNTLQQLVKSEQKVISIFTYATGEKCYSKKWWKEFYLVLQNEFPEYLILEILPKENISQIDFAAPTFYSCDIREICGVLANTSVFIGADSGMMHLAVAAKIPVMGLFSVTNAEKYQPYGNKNCAVQTGHSSVSEIICQLKEMIR